MAVRSFCHAILALALSVQLAAADPGLHFVRNTPKAPTRVGIVDRSRDKNSLVAASRRAKLATEVGGLARIDVANSAEVATLSQLPVAWNLAADFAQAAVSASSCLEAIHPGMSALAWLSALGSEERKQVDRQAAISQLMSHLLTCSKELNDEKVGGFIMQLTRRWLPRQTWSPPLIAADLQYPAIDRASTNNLVPISLRSTETLSVRIDDDVLASSPSEVALTPGPHIFSTQQGAVLSAAYILQPKPKRVTDLDAQAVSWSAQQTQLLPQVPADNTAIATWLAAVGAKLGYSYIVVIGDDGFELWPAGAKRMSARSKDATDMRTHIAMLSAPLPDPGIARQTYPDEETEQESDDAPSWLIYASVFAVLAGSTTWFLLARSQDDEQRIHIEIPAK